MMFNPSLLNSFQVLLIFVWLEAGQAAYNERELQARGSEKADGNIVSHSCIHDQIIEQRKRPGLKVYSVKPQVYEESVVSKPLFKRGRTLLEASEFSGKQEDEKQPIRISLNYDAVGHSSDRDCRNVGDIVKVCIDDGLVLVLFFWRMQLRTEVVILCL